MSSDTVRITAKARRALKELAEMTGDPMTVVMEHAIELYRRQRFLEECNRAYAALRADPKAWQEELAERALWENTLADGLEDE